MHDARSGSSERTAPFRHGPAPLAGLLCLMAISHEAVFAQSRSREEAAKRITAEAVYQRIAVLAADSMAGRDTPSPGLEQAANWIAKDFQTLALRGVGDAGSYLQRFPLLRTRLSESRSALTVGGTVGLAFGRDVVWVAGSRDVQHAGGRVVVVAGAPAPEALQRAGVRGATVLVVAPTTPERRLAPAAQRLMEALIPRRPAALVFVADVADSVWARYVAGQQRVVLRPPWQDSVIPPVLLARQSVLAPLMAPLGADPAELRAAPVDYVAEIRGLVMTATVRSEVVEAVTAPNVIGLVEGSDPSLRDEYIIYTAHFDHIGIAGSPSGCVAQGADSICNGADDNASGAAVVMAVAEAFAALREGPKRTVMFALVSGEENGLWGSDYLAATLPGLRSRVVANINVDNVGRNWRDTVVAIGKRHSDLGETLDRVNAAHPELNMLAIDNPWGMAGLYSRSDHYNFARRGVPILFFVSGLHADYHRPSDEIAKVDAEKTARIARLLFYLGLDVANGARRPQWDPASYRLIVEQAWQ